jgi:hypothetical protein
MCEFVSRLVPIPHARAGGAGRSAKTPTRSLRGGDLGKGIAIG